MIKGIKAITCSDCVNYQKTLLKYDDGSSIYDCPFAHDWCESDTLINTLCEHKFKSKENN